jgi:hypothetical protein
MSCALIGARLPSKTSVKAPEGITQRLESRCFGSPAGHRFRDSASFQPCIVSVFAGCRPGVLPRVHERKHNRVETGTPFDANFGVLQTEGDESTTVTFRVRNRPPVFNEFDVPDLFTQHEREGSQEFDNH